MLVDADNRILSTGYNGVARGVKHCIDHPCAGANAKSGTGLELCEAIHAEANALIACNDVRHVHTAYITCTPCIHCVKLLLGSHCIRIVAAERYPHDDAQALWQSAGREWVVLAPQPELTHDQRYGPMRNLIGAGLAVPTRK